MNSARETAAAVRSGRSSAIAETEAAIQRIEADDPAINAVVVRRFEAARRDAQAVDARLNTGEDLPLAGVAMTVKESFDVAGLPTTWGMMDHADHRADADAEIVRRLKMAGAVILGKTNVPPMLADWQSANPVYGVTRNPHDRARVPGGSSGGAAAALASHMVPLEYGSDIGGSVRVPAGFCGVWGLKTSYGAVPMGGHFLPGLHGAPAEMGVCGPLARAPEDLRLALELTAAVPLDRRVPDTLAGLRIAPLFTHPVAGVRDEIGKVGQATLDAAARAGAEIVEDVPWPDLAAMHADYVRLLLTTIGRGQPLPDGTQPVTLEAWWQMLDARARWIAAWDAVYDRVDAVLMPVAGITAFEHDAGDSQNRMVEIDGEATPWGAQLAWAGMANYTGFPSCAFPAGTDAAGLPIGYQLMTPMWTDHRAAALAKLIDLAK